MRWEKVTHLGSPISFYHLKIEKGFIMKDKLRQIMIVIAVLVTITVNGLANALPLNGQLTGEISNRFVVFFTPAGYVFSIWGVIYLGLMAYVVFQALPSQRENPVLRAIGMPVLISSLANSAWIFLWHYNVFPLTLVVMLVLLASLINTYLKLGIGRRQASRSETYFVHLPFSIYLGWISVATIANATALLDYWKWNAWGIPGETWTAIMLSAGVILSGLMSFIRRDVAYSLVLVWAFIGIAVKHATNPVVMGAAWAAVGFVVVLFAMVWLWRRQVTAVKTRI
jgi:benzodiazapine receptor